MVMMLKMTAMTMTMSPSLCYVFSANRRFAFLIGPDDTEDDEIEIVLVVMMMMMAADVEEVMMLRTLR